ncbi:MULTISPECIES: DUF1963 domain-containing protein [Bacillus]|uniref:DUF1963 domain-containing protein n=1 Tax=Bacillus TaxID=1386 RepID=UPI0005C80A07|nr:MULTISPECIES: DUF1963 domain-containing protein [Bacillus]APJ10230.1 hypothetical protein BSL056_04420 [Bacillus safensis]KIZ50220.1 hypothetical protein UM92_18125 [Bacillus safensis]MBR0615414.1 DUF1963 domain-containing protein [Bacillus safensis]MBR0637350.1 DUF1963 domain-containing protein [Bacillus safensis]NRF05413.1 DUF1963 domain-containing protein [Bacillus safensis]
MEIKAFQELNLIGKTPAIAKIGGFRPDPAIHSWFAGHFFIDPNQGWPTDQDGAMIPILQIYLPEVPGGINGFNECKLIQIFLNQKTLPIDITKNGEGWKLIEYSSIEGLEVAETPEEVRGLKAFQIQWNESEQRDFPCWEEAWSYVDLTEVNESEEATDHFFNQYTNYSFTKIGGYGAYIQSPPHQQQGEFMLQIASEEKPRFMIGDNGTMYFYYDKESKEWFMHWDCF